MYLHILTIQLICECSVCLFYAAVDGERSRRSTVVSVFPPLEPHLRNGQISRPYTVEIDQLTPQQRFPGNIVRIPLMLKLVAIFQ